MTWKSFSLRDALFVIAIVAVLLGWWVDRRQVAAAPGRFQMQIVNGQAMMLDTATGRVFYQGDANFTGPKDGK